MTYHTDIPLDDLSGRHPSYNRQSGPSWRRSISILILLHAALAVIFLVFVILHARHADYNWTIDEKSINRTAAVATYVTALAIVCFILPSLYIGQDVVHSSVGKHAHTARQLFFVHTVLAIGLVAVAPNLVKVSLSAIAPRPHSAGRIPYAINAHDRFGSSTAVSNVTGSGKVSVDPAAFYVSSNYPSTLFAGVTALIGGQGPDVYFNDPSPAGVTGNVVHDFVRPGSPSPGRPDPDFDLPADATRMSVTCMSIEGARFDVTSTKLDAINDEYATLAGVFDLPDGRGTLRFDDVMYFGKDNSGPFGDADWLAGLDTKMWARFPKIFDTGHTQGTASAPDLTVNGVKYDRHEGRSGISNDLMSTVFFYVLRAGDKPETDENGWDFASVPIDKDATIYSISSDKLPQYVTKQFTKGLTFFTVQPIACTLSAQPYTGKLNFVTNTFDISSIPADPNVTSTKWTPYKLKSVPPNFVPQNGDRFESNFANIFTPFSSPLALGATSTGDGSDVPNYHPLTALESYMTFKIGETPTIASLELQLEKITALAFAGIAEKFSFVEVGAGPDVPFIAGAARIVPGPLYFCFVVSFLLLGLSGLLWYQDRKRSVVPGRA